MYLPHISIYILSDLFLLEFFGLIMVIVYVYGYRNIIMEYFYLAYHNFFYVTNNLCDT